MGRTKFRLLFSAVALLAGTGCGSNSGPGPGVLADGAVIDVDGNVIGPDGAVLGPDGGPLLDPDGNVVGPGLNPDGSGRKIVDPTGVWWTEVNTKGEQNLPTVGLLEGSNLRFVMRITIEGSVPNQTATFEFCKLQTDWASDVLPDDVHVIGFRPASVAAFTETRTVDFSQLSVGDAVPLPDMTFIAGADETGALVDEDGDGYPAITTFVRVILPFEVAEVINIDASLDLAAVEENVLEGTLDFNVTADIIDSSSAVFVPPSFDVTITPDSNAVPLTVHRLEGGGDCSAIPSTVEFMEIPPSPGPPIDPVFGPSEENPNP